MKIESNQSTVLPKNSENDQEIFDAFELLKQKRFMFRHFIDGLLNNNFVPISTEEVEKIVDDNFFSFEPMVDFSKEQNELLRLTIVNHLCNKQLNREQYGLLCGPVYQESQTRGVLYDVNDNPKASVLSLKEKLALFDVEVWRNIQIKFRNYQCGVLCWGNRSLERIGFPDDKWLELIERVKTSTGKSELAILDIGCGLGEAMDDMKRIDPTSDVHGITLEQEVGMYDSGQFHYIAAERMPAEFKNRFDLILSNISFRYHLFPNISLRNAILALSIGGHAEIGFSYDRIPDEDFHNEYFSKNVPGSRDSYDAMKQIIKKDWNIIKSLEKEGKLKLVTSEDFGTDDYYHGWIEIDKLQQLEPEDFL